MIIKKRIGAFWENAKKNFCQVYEKLERFFYARDTSIFREKIKELFFVVKLLRLMEAIRCGNYKVIFMSVIIDIIIHLWKKNKFRFMSVILDRIIHLWKKNKFRFMSVILDRIIHLCYGKRRIKKEE